MAFLRIIIILAIIVTGGALAYNQQAKKAEQSVAAWDGAVTSGVVSTENAPPSGLAKAWAKIKNAFDGKRDDVSDENQFADNEARDLGRLKGHFKAVPDNK